MIYTSYFAKMRKMTDEQKARCVSIARFTPKGVNIPQMTFLAPEASTLKNYKATGDEDDFYFDYHYQLEHLAPDMPMEKLAALLEGKILCCYEKSSDFCHRHLIAEWLRSHGVECEELTI